MNSYAVLPCNGLDKTAGCLTKEIALLLQEAGSDIICPVLYRNVGARYDKIAHDKPLLVLDGCGTRCASKLAAEKGLKITQKKNITEESKRYNIGIGTSLREGNEEKHLCQLILKDLLNEEMTGESKEGKSVFPAATVFEEYRKDKFIFRVPKDDFLFNENECWVYVSGKSARVGVTDFMQKNLSDIMFYTPPELGASVSQFDEVGSIESGKAVFEVISPVSGIVKAINNSLIDNPEYINESPYEKGWIAELELTDFEGDRDLLLLPKEYFEIMKRKVDEIHAKQSKGHSV